MTQLTLALSDELRDRMQDIAARTGRSLDDCAQLALQEFVLHWETHLRDVEDLDEDVPDLGRPSLRAVNE